MSKTIDALQKQLQEEVFHYAKDSKKAAGRALGTIVEIITYYKLCAWGFSENTLIEKPIPEFGRADIRHNVEFSLHKAIVKTVLALPRNDKSITAKTLGKAANIEVTSSTAVMLSSKGILRNSAVISELNDRVVVANLTTVNAATVNVLVAELNPLPVAIFECKRVGVEEGMKKGPQSIEKAKQGAYVARSVSALQKIVDRDGQVLGFLPSDQGAPLIEPYDELLARIVSGEMVAPKGFVLTVGVVSNHGNWFTSDNMNKEMKVLASAYDWLLFLTDDGLVDFVETCLLSLAPKYAPIRKAFIESYTGVAGKNRFTKTKLDLAADQALRSYFVANQVHSNNWFNVIAPVDDNLESLSKQLRVLVS